MRSLLLVAHGSRRELSNEEVRRVSQQIEKLAGENFLSINCAFLELAIPSIPEGIDQCINEGATSVIVFPYFLSAGRHVSEDIPKIIRGKQQEYPSIEIKIVEHVGAVTGMADLILQHISTT